MPDNTAPVPLLTVIVPTFNPGPKLEATLLSVLEQGASSCEVLVMDGGSTDGTQVLLERYAGRVRFRCEPDVGVYDAMNKGIAYASGRYLAFLGAGDSLRDGVVACLAPLLPDAVSLVYGNAFYVSENKAYGGPYSAYRLMRENICHQAIFYHRDVFRRVGVYELKYPLWADYALNLKCFADPQIEKRYADLLIANYEGGGMSAYTEDPVFLQERGRLILRTLGWVLWARWQGRRLALWLLSVNPLLGRVVNALRGTKSGSRP